MGKSRVSLSRVKREFSIVMLGLDGSGKTTLMHCMKKGEFVPSFPTVGFGVETVWATKKGVHFTVWDVGGNKHIRPLWRHFYKQKQGVIFVVDSSDRVRVKEAKDELHTLLREYDLRDALLLIMATKKDRAGAMTKEELFVQLNIESIKNREFFLQMCDSESGEGVLEGLDWLRVKAHGNAEIKL
eukprot:c10333_g1_i1.p1 GENE.c10333_g1_i1~~c10333_g1_i1.p1  ORF type:complete len:185 (+),score=42.16 c10333_g1_i1:31-585(+)